MAFSPRPFALPVLLASLMCACGRMPTPLAPHLSGSLGMPHRGALTGAAALPKSGAGFERLRDNKREFGVPRFSTAIQRAAHRVSVQRPGGVLVVGDFSSERGGMVLPHFSHRNGRDVDLLFYVQTLDGEPVKSPGFIHFGPDGLAWDPDGMRFYRLDVEREWLLIRALIEDPDARVQWLFVSRAVQGLLYAWAEARGESPLILSRAKALMMQPNPGGVHDDHLHVRSACAPAERATGCEDFGIERPWLRGPIPASDPHEVADALFAILEPSSFSEAPELVSTR